jgi:predicted ATPase/class 3 adenylate cyclase
MQCPQCQQENREGRRFCAECGAPLSLSCNACTFVNEPGEKFCGGCGVLLTAQPSTPSPVQPTQHQPETQDRFHALLPDVMARLQRDRRVTYRMLKYVFSLDDASLEDIREELILRRLVIDEAGKVLVWTGETQPLTTPVEETPSPSATGDTTAVTSLILPTPSPVTETTMPTHGPTELAEAIAADAQQDKPGVTPESVRSTSEAERRQLTVMFCDLADSTRLSQQLDPEDLREVIRAYQQTGAEVIQRFDGHIAQHLGDGLLIYFGWPVAHEDDAQRALHAGLGIVEAITTTLNPRLEQEKGGRLTVRLGVHTGPVVVGEMGGGGRHEHLATGETVNMASRLEGLAAPNTVVISSVTERLVRGAFALEDLGLQMLKGVAEPIQVFGVLGAVEMDDEEHVAAGIPFLVGRDEEIGLLLRRWEQSKAGLGQVVQLSGEAGIGKSALVEVLRAHIRAEGLPCITFHCSPYHQNSALYPVITHLEHLLYFEREDSPAAKLDKLEQCLQPYSLPLAEVVPLVAALLSVPLQGRYVMPSLTPQQHKQQTLDALVAWLVDEAERQPLLLVWENLHWADPSTLEMLALVLDQTPTVPMCSVFTFRPEFHPPWPTRSHLTPITLNRLERPQVEAVITHLAGGKPLPEEVVHHIVTKTDGVPLYVEELTKMVLASALLREDVAQYVLTGPLVSVAIPDTLQDSLMARLDQLNTAKEVAQLGAVLGREFSYEMLQLVAAQDEATVHAGLARLVEAELLYRRGRPPRARYRFKHALIQDAAYASLLRSTRQQVHQHVAHLLETRFPELVETQPELVAHHYTAAGRTEPAIGYWQQAGQRAIERSANAEAIAHLTQGLTFLQEFPETPARQQQELDLQVALGPALIAIKGYGVPEVERTYARARELCEQVGNTPQLFAVLRGLSVYYVNRGDLQMAYQLGEQLLRLARSQPDPAYLLLAHYMLGQILFYRGEPAAAQTYLAQALAIYIPQEHQSLAVRYGLELGVASGSYLALGLGLLGYADQAVQRIQETRTLAQEVSHPYSLDFTLLSAAILHQFRHEVPTAHEQATAAMTLATEQAHANWFAWGMILHGWTRAMQGQCEEGIAQIRQGLTAEQATGLRAWQPYFLGLLAEAYGKGGHPEAGLATLADALAIVDTTEVRFYVAELFRLQGTLLLWQTIPDASQAETCFHQALDIARAQQAKFWELRAATSLARLWQSQGKRQDAHDLLAPVYGWFTEGFDTADLQDAKVLLHELEA